MRILVVEDEKKTATFIKRGLEEEGYNVEVAYDGLEGQNRAEAISYDLIILDIILPGRSGLDVLGELRKKKVSTPILMLTCKQNVEDKFNGLSRGADDYLAKPFHFEELLARIQALLRRQGQAFSSRLAVGDLVMDILTREVQYKHQPLDLSVKEYAVLECLMRHPNIVLSRTAIEQRVWKQEFTAGSSNLVDIYIGHLRRKLGEGDDNPIQTVYGTGYRLKGP